MSSSSSEEDYDIRFVLPQGVGDTEDVENYRQGGYHPVHLGDKFDDERYRVVHKLGAGGFSTVWLARDERENRWVALKLVNAKHSVSTKQKSDLCRSILGKNDLEFVAQHEREFFFDGPNGRHLCLVLPVLGPSMSELSYNLASRVTPQFARKVAHEAIQAVEALHCRGLCHGDVTTGNILLRVIDIDSYTEDDIYRVFGQPVQGELMTESGVPQGTEAPRYIVRSIDFLSTTYSLIDPHVKLVDFDQCFATSSPPQKMLGTPLEFLAPEVAVGQAAGPASDVWALGCCIFRLRSGQGPFSNPFSVTTPVDLINYIIHTLGDMPLTWRETTLWDRHGQPTKDAGKGKRMEQWWTGPERSLRQMIDNIWEEPEGRAVETRVPRQTRAILFADRHRPYPSHFADIAWKPGAVKAGNDYISGYNKEWNMILEALPKISHAEADLLHDLLSKVFVFEPTERITAKEMLAHPWFDFKES